MAKIFRELASGTFSAASQSLVALNVPSELILYDSSFPLQELLSKPPWYTRVSVLREPLFSATAPTAPLRAAMLCRTEPSLLAISCGLLALSSAPRPLIVLCHKSSTATGFRACDNWVHVGH